MANSEIEQYLLGLHDPDKKVRTQNMVNLIHSGVSAIPGLLSLIDDESWVIRYRVAEALGGIRDKGTTDSLIHLTFDEKDHVRYMATKSLGMFQESRLTPVLIRMLSDDHSYTRKIAANGLANTGDSSAVEALEKRLKNESDPDVRAALQNALVRFNNNI